MKKIITALLCITMAMSSVCFADEPFNKDDFETCSIDVKFTDMGEYVESLYTGLVVDYNGQKLELRPMNDALINDLDINKLNTGDKLTFMYTRGKGEKIPDMIIPDAMSSYNYGGYLTTIESVIFNDDSIDLVFENGNKLTASGKDINYDWNEDLEVNENTLTVGSTVYVHNNEVDVLNIANLSEKLVFEGENVQTSYFIPQDKMGKRIGVGKTMKINGTEYIPLRKTFENIGPNYRVYWDAEDGIVLLHNNTKYIITDGEPGVKTSKLKVVFSYDDACAVVQDGVTYVPVSWVTSTFGVATERMSTSDATNKLA